MVKPIRNKKLSKLLLECKNLSPYPLISSKLKNYRLIEDLVKIPLLNEYANISEIPWSTLPDKFVIKADTGASNQNVKCLVKLKEHKFYDELTHSKIKKPEIIKFFESYSPILIENMLSDKNQGKIPFDFKFYIAYDELLFLRVVDRNQRDKIPRIGIFDAKFNRIPHQKWFYPDMKYFLPMTMNYQVPSIVHEAKNVAIKIGMKLQISFVSVDMYLLNNSDIYLGELTYIPGAMNFDHFKENYEQFIISKIEQKNEILTKMRLEA